VDGRRNACRARRVRPEADVGCSGGPCRSFGPRHEPRFALRPMRPLVVRAPWLQHRGCKLPVPTGCRAASKRPGSSLSGNVAPGARVGYGQGPGARQQRSVRKAQGALGSDLRARRPRPRSGGAGGLLRRRGAGAARPRPGSTMRSLRWPSAASSRWSAVASWRSRAHR